MEKGQPEWQTFGSKNIGKHFGSLINFLRRQVRFVDIPVENELPFSMGKGEGRIERPIDIR